MLISVSENLITTLKHWWGFVMTVTNMQLY